VNVRRLAEHKKYGVGDVFADQQRTKFVFNRLLKFADIPSVSTPVFEALGASEA